MATARLDLAAANIGGHECPRMAQIGRNLRLKPVMHGAHGAGPSAGLSAARVVLGVIEAKRVSELRLTQHAWSRRLGGSALLVSVRDERRATWTVWIELRWPSSA